jgi:O-antigen/teichoic acid export membrane protein
LEEQKEYNSILKATTFFGGMQIILILISLLRIKFTASFLGPNGLGIFSMLSSTLAFMVSLTSFSIGVSSIKNISESFSADDSLKISRTVVVIQRLAWITGSFGMLIMIFISGILSRFTFANNNYTLDFIVLSISILLTQLTSANLAILQGLRKTNLLVKSNIYGSIFSLLLIVPIYYFYKIAGIPYVILLVSLFSYTFSYYFAKKIQIQKVVLNKLRFWLEGKSILKTGFSLGISGIITLGIGYLLNLTINKIGGSVQLGFFSAGFMIINNYTGIIFSAISTDYHPRLSQLSKYKDQTLRAINQQAHIAILLLTPLIIFLVVFLKYFIITLYNEDFLVIQKMVYWILPGIVIKATSWSMSFVFVAQGKVKVFFWNELFSNLYIFIINIIAFNYWGLEGLGFSYLLSYLIYLFHIYFLTKKYYDFHFETNILLTLLISFITIIFAIFNMLYLPSPTSLFLGTFLGLCATVTCIKIIQRKSNIFGDLYNSLVVLFIVKIKSLRSKIK